MSVEDHLVPKIFAAALWKAQGPLSPIKYYATAAQVTILFHNDRRMWKRSYKAIQAYQELDKELYQWEFITLPTDKFSAFFMKKIANFRNDINFGSSYSASDLTISRDLTVSGAMLQTFWPVSVDEVKEMMKKSLNKSHEEVNRSTYSTDNSYYYQFSNWTGGAWLSKAYYLSAITQSSALEKEDMSNLPFICKLLPVCLLKRSIIIWK